MIAALSLLGLFAAAPASRDPRDAEAERLCLSGKPDEGIALLAKLYVETNNPDHIYNQARCFQQAGRWTEAILRFREYLRKVRNLTAADREDVERKIRESEQMIAAPPPPPPAPRDDAGEALRPWRKGALIAAGAALAAGVALSFTTRALEGEANSKTETDQWNDSLDRWGEATEVAQYITYGTAGAAAIAALVLHLGIDDGNEARGTSALAPLVTASGGGVAWCGRF